MCVHVSCCVGRGVKDGTDAGFACEMHGAVACNCCVDCGNEWAWQLVGAVNENAVSTEVTAH